MAIKIDTAQVMAAADRIATTNSNLRTDFSTVESAVNALNSCWDGSASEKAMNAFYSIRNTLPDARKDVVQSMVSFMKMQVCDGYEKTEAQLSSNASAFK